MKNAIKSRVEYFRNRNSAPAVAGAGAAALTVSESSQAALDPAVATAFTGLAGDFGSLMTAAYPVMITIATGLAVFGLVRMMIHKGAGK